MRALHYVAESGAKSCSRKQSHDSFGNNDHHELFGNTVIKGSESKTFWEYGLDCHENFQHRETQRSPLSIFGDNRILHDDGKGIYYKRSWH